MSGVSKRYAGVQVNEGAFFYPDIAMVCGETKYRSDSRDNLLNPLVVIEGLSPSTEDYDRGRKFAQHHQITTLQD